MVKKLLDPHMVEDQVVVVVAAVMDREFFSKKGSYRGRGFWRRRGCDFGGVVSGCGVGNPSPWEAAQVAGFYRWGSLGLRSSVCEERVCVATALVVMVVQATLMLRSTV